MKTSVLINNYNYANYACEAVKSVLEQTLLPNEIIVVDDGSTDDSVARLNKAFGSEKSVHIIPKENGGQLSAFNTAYELAKGDVIFFLDADDLYKKTYIETVVNFYRSSPECDFLYCALEEFGLSDETIMDYDCDRDLGYSILLTIFRNIYIGGQTSTVSVRKDILDKFMPIPLERDWPISADSCLIVGTSIAAAHKFFLADPLVRYRVHGKNGWYGIVKSQLEWFEREIKFNILKQFLVNKLGYDLNTLQDLIVAEFNSTTRNQLEYRFYYNIIRRSSKNYYWRRSMLKKIKKRYERMKA